MRILVIGGGGQVGGRVVEACQRSNHDVYATYISRPPSLNASRVIQLDKTVRDSVFKLIEKIKPEAVIDTAALHNVDYCEEHRDEAWKVNVEGTKNVAEACSLRSAKMIFVSTDFVFDGENGHYKEADETHPVNSYGLSKLEGERIIQQICEKRAIIRPSVIYSWVEKADEGSSSGKPLNFAMWVVHKLKQKEQIRIVNDQYGSPTLADNLADALIEVAESDKVGVYHVAGKSRLSRFDFTMRLAEYLNLDRSLINSINTQQLRQVAKRPKDSSLDVSKAERELKVGLLDIDEALKIVVGQAKVG